MGLLPKSLTSVSNAIGDALTAEQLSEIVLEATAQPYDAFVPDNHTTRQAVSLILQALMKEGTEHWLLTKVTAVLVSDFAMRRLIARSCPESLTPPLPVEKQVERAAAQLDGLIPQLLTPTYKPELKRWRDVLCETARQLAHLAAYKNLHELLHGLHLKLTFQYGAGPIPGLPAHATADCQGLVAEMCRAARQALDAAGFEPAAAQTEREWIERLEAFAALPPPPAAEALADAQREIRLRLSGLNKSIFETADDLSMHELIAALPPDLRYEEELIVQFMHAFLDLKATVIARAIVHKVWQDADNDLSLLRDFIDLPSKKIEQILQHWVTLQPRIVWLGSLDPDADWFKAAATYAEQISERLADEALTVERFDGDVKSTFENYFRLVKFRFLAIDARLKAECRTLARIQEPLQRIAAKIG